MSTESLPEPDPPAEPAGQGVGANSAAPGPLGFLSDVPDPSGPPVPVKQRPFQFTLRSMMLATAACGGVFYVLSQCETTSTAGATRSSRLKWQERQFRIEQAELQLPIEQTEQPEHADESAAQPFDAAPADEDNRHD